MRKQMDERENLLMEVIGKTDVEPARPPINTVPLFPLRQIWPDVIALLKSLLTEAGEIELAATVDGLEVYDRCRCGADYCATVYTKPRPSGSFGPGHRGIAFLNADANDLDAQLRVADTSTAPTTKYETILDVVNGEIHCIEILEDHESRHRLVAALPEDCRG